MWLRRPWPAAQPPAALLLPLLRALQPHAAVGAAMAHTRRQNKQHTRKSHRLSPPKNLPQASRGLIRPSAPPRLSEPELSEQRQASRPILGPSHRPLSLLSRKLPSQPTGSVRRSNTRLVHALLCFEARPGAQPSYRPTRGVLYQHRHHRMPPAPTDRHRH